MVGSSSAFRTLKGQLDKVTKSNGRVMLTGGPGTGKEVAARYIHAESNRADAPFVTVSSASIQPDHMEEVLFGRESQQRGGQPRVKRIPLILWGMLTYHYYHYHFLFCW